MAHSGNKGKRGERWARDIIKSWGFFARRGQQFAGHPDAPDVVHDIASVFVEAKWDETVSVHRAIEQAILDSGPDDVPIVLLKRNGKRGLLIVPVESGSGKKGDPFEPSDAPLELAARLLRGPSSD
jgi:hypothetical protein